MSNGKIIRMRSAAVLLAGLLLSSCGLLSSQPEQKLDDVFIGVNYVGVSVSDAEASAQYYASAFDTQVIERESFGEAGWPSTLAGKFGEEAVSILVRSTNAQLRLFSYGDGLADGLSAVPVTGPGMAHVCFQVDQDTGAYGKALAAGAMSIGAEELVPLSSRNPVKYGYITDGDGIITEVEHVDVAKLDLPEPPKNQYRMRHVALATPDVDALAEFYSALLGGQEPRRIGQWLNISGENVDKVSGLAGSEIEMAWFQFRNIELEIAQLHSHPTTRPETPRPFNAPGYNIIMLDVSDLAAARARLLEAGGTIVEEGAIIDGAETILARDPDGNLLGFQKLADNSIYSAKNFADNGI